MSGGSRGGRGSGGVGVARVLAGTGCVLWLACHGDPLAGRRFACEPGVEGQCLPGWWCRPVTGKEYPGVCERAGACTPDCSGKECGADGCGGTCGTCSGPQEVCVEGQCVCQPACAAKECGDDGCGGTCGTCPAGSDCQAGRCKPTCWTGPCEPGYQKYDGCRCKVAPTGVSRCKVPGQTSLVDCSTIQPDDEGYGQDGHFPSGPLEFTDIGGGAVRDERTGLVWSKVADDYRDWDDAKLLCSNKGWHLPGVIELVSIVDYSKEECPMWPAVFGTGCPSDPWFWTSVPSSLLSAFYVGFSHGDVYGYDISYFFGVRCVRAGQ